MDLLLKHQSWPINKLIEYENNPRINDQAITKITEAIKAFGFRIPIVAKSDGTVVDGHLRLKAARQLGMTKIPVVLADDLTDAQIKAFRISVNKMAELADWDEYLLRAELKLLQGTDFDLNLLGFDLSEIKDLTASSFTPNYQPNLSTNEISADDLIHAQEQMNHDLTSNLTRKIFIDIECPYCKTQFKIEDKK